MSHGPWKDSLDFGGGSRYVRVRVGVMVRVTVTADVPCHTRQDCVAVR